jgi:hypothetical protein
MRRLAVYSDDAWNTRAGGRLVAALLSADASLQRAVMPACPSTLLAVAPLPVLVQALDARRVLQGVPPLQTLVVPPALLATAQTRSRAASALAHLSRLECVDVSRLILGGQDAQTRIRELVEVVAAAPTLQAVRVLAGQLGPEGLAFLSAKLPAQISVVGLDREQDLRMVVKGKAKTASASGAHPGRDVGGVG